MSKPLSKTARRALAATVALAALAIGAEFRADPAKQYFPLATFRVGAYASSGIPVWAGEIDYFRYVNDVEGGINGVKLVWDECETEWAVEKGVECYERVKGGKDGSPVPIFLPHGDPISKALTEKSVADKIPLVTIAYGRTESIDGRVFPYSFPVVFSFWSEASSVINYIAERERRQRQAQGPEDRDRLPRQPLRQGDAGPARVARQDLWLRGYRDSRAASGQRPVGAVGEDPPDQARLCVPAWLGRHDAGGDQNCGEDRLPRRSHHRRRLVGFRGGRAAGGRGRQGLSRDRRLSPPGRISRSPRRSRPRSSTRARATSRT